jgi:hypothetical protein
MNDQQKVDEFFAAIEPEEHCRVLEFFGKLCAKPEADAVPPPLSGDSNPIVKSKKIPKCLCRHRSTQHQDDVGCTAQLPDGTFCLCRHFMETTGTRK